MTKINKLGKSTFVIAILSFLLVAVLAFGGTYAYFSADSGVVSSTVTTATIKIDESNVAQSTLVATGSKIVPGETLIKEALSVTYTANAKAVIIAVMDLKIDGTNNVGEGNTTITASSLGFELGEGWTKVSEEGAASTAYVLGSDATPYVETSGTANLTKSPVKLALTVEGQDNMNVEITITVRFVACQYDYIKDAQGTAWGAEEAPSCEDVYEAVRANVIKDLPVLTAA